MHRDRLNIAFEVVRYFEAINSRTKRTSLKWKHLKTEFPNELRVHLKDFTKTVLALTNHASSVCTVHGAYGI